jgi:hypothetical protein
MDVSGRTLLISEPNLNNQTAALLGNFTNRGFMIVEQRYYLYCHSSKAIYIGECPTIKRIQHAIYIDVTPALNAEKRVPPEGVELSVADLNAHLAKYRERNLAQVRRLEFTPLGSRRRPAPSPNRSEAASWIRPTFRRRLFQFSRCATGNRSLKGWIQQKP